MSWPPEGSAARFRKPEELRDAGTSTRAVHGGEYTDLSTGARGTPIFQAVTFHYPHLPLPEGGWSEQPAPYIYTRYANPTVEAVEVKMAALEGTESAIAFSSGMAAIAGVVMSLVQSGERFVSQKDLYGVTHTLFTKEFPRTGVRCDLVDPDDLDRVASALKGAQLLYLESPTNPLLRVVDVPTLTRMAHEAGAKVVLDSTFGTPVNQSPVTWGVDVVVHSGTKYLNGHSDVIAGLAACSAEAAKDIREKRIVWGGSVDPHQAFLLLRGMKTLALRVARANENGQEIAEFLSKHPKIGKVWYPGLPSHPSHKLAARIMRGFGGVLACTVKGGDAAAEKLMQSLKLVAMASSLGGVESLASMPVQTSHLALSPEERKAMGIEPGLVRFAFGIEDPKDLIGDLEHGLRKV